MNKMDNQMQEDKTKKAELRAKVRGLILKSIVEATKTLQTEQIFSEPKATLHKQARGYLKTTSRLVSRDTSGEQSLFDISDFETAINPYKETLSKMTAITGNLLLALWQARQDNGILKITNLSETARQIEATPQDLKLYLICLGGYQVPITTLSIVKEKGKKTKRILSIYHDKLFFVKFNIRLRDNETEASFNDNYRTGTRYCSFIKDRDVESVEVMPSETLRADLQGRGLGNILVDDGFVAFSLGLSDLAYKIFCFSGSNKPTFTIGFDKLIGANYLNLEKQVKAQGKPRVLQTIKKAFGELVEKGHLLKWDYNDKKDALSWTYTDKIFKHKQLDKAKLK